MMIMSIKLTSEQRAALESSDGLVAVEDEVNKRLYFLVDESTLANLKLRDDEIAIREGIADMEAGRVVTLEELDRRIRARLASL